MDAEEQRRLARNESAFRASNARTKEGVDGILGDETDRCYELACECALAVCSEKISVSQREYDEVRSYPNRFMVKPGHLEKAIERTLEKGERYWVVAKEGEAKTVAEHTAPPP